MKTPRAAIYLRLDTDEDPESHLTELREYAFALGVDVVGEFVDVGRAGDSTDRKKLDAVNALVDAGTLAVLLTTELHRLARHATHDLLYQIEALVEAEVRLIATRDEVDTDEARGRAIVDAIKLVGEVETELARQRIKVGIAKARKRPGHQHGRPRAVGVERVVALHKKGFTINRIAKELSVSATTVKARLREWRKGQSDG